MTPVQDRGQALLGLTALGLGFGLPDRRLLRGPGAGQLDQHLLDPALAALGQLLAERCEPGAALGCFPLSGQQKTGECAQPPGSCHSSHSSCLILQTQ